MSLGVILFTSEQCIVKSIQIMSTRHVKATFHSQSMGRFADDSYTVLCDFDSRFVNAVGHVCGFVCSCILSDSAEIFSVTFWAGVLRIVWAMTTSYSWILQWASSLF